MKIILTLLLPVSLWAQTATLRGVVADESGAVIPKASVTIKGPTGLSKAAVTADDGSYVFAGLATGTYSVQASAPDLVLPKPIGLNLKPGVQVLNLQLAVASTVQQVTVQEQAGPTVSVLITASPI